MHFEEEDKNEDEEDSDGSWKVCELRSASV